MYLYIYINMFLDLGDCFFRFLEVFSSKPEGWRGGGVEGGIAENTALLRAE